jgi:uncharacterized Zn finger protein
MTLEERIAEYVDSPLVTQRVRYGQQVSAQFAGHYGVYRTQVSQANQVEGDCTCPSESWPCKHLHALRATWKANPGSFFDLDEWLKELPKQSKENLVEAIGKMVIESPTLLRLFGIAGFEDDQDGEEYEDC